MKRSAVAMALFLLSLPSAQSAEPIPAVDIYRSIHSAERTSRFVGSSIRAAIGLSLFGAGITATGTRRFMVIGGVSAIAYSLKGFLVPTLTEELAARLADSPGRFEPEALHYLSDTSRQNRIWDGTLSTGMGTFITVSGAFIEEGSFLSIFAYVSGGLMVGNGLYRLLFRSASERAVDRYFESRKNSGPQVSLAPTFGETPDGRADGLGLALSLAL